MTSAPLLRLPTETLLDILGLVPYADLQRVRRVSRLLSALVRHRSLQACLFQDAGRLSGFPSELKAEDVRLHPYLETGLQYLGPSPADSSGAQPMKLYIDEDMSFGAPPTAETPGLDEFATQPAVRRLQVEIDQPSWYECERVLAVANPAGVRVRDVLGALRQLEGRARLKSWEGQCGLWMGPGRNRRRFEVRRVDKGGERIVLLMATPWFVTLDAARSLVASASPFWKECVCGRVNYSMSDAVVLDRTLDHFRATYCVCGLSPPSPSSTPASSP